MELYRVVEGWGFEQWRGILTAPGGSEAVGRWSDLGDGIWAALPCEPGDSPGKAERAGRWKMAQGAEANFWRGWRRHPLYGHLSLIDYWADVLEKTGGPLPAGRILDIGCGPVSVLNFFRGESVEPFGLDPLALVYAGERLVETRLGWEPIAIAALGAEALPFADKSLDHVICFNMLDHVADAPAVLAEMNRVLRPGGSARICVHTFAKSIKRLLFFDRPHTYHWDHEELRSLLCGAGFGIAVERTERKKFDLPPGLPGRLRYFPYWVASKISSTAYFRLIKPA